jgi:apolipoprotein N-acyltransferase
MDKIISLAFIMVFGAFSVILFACAIAQFRWDYAIYCIFTFIITCLLVKEMKEE